MKTNVIIGGGAAGILSALLIARSHPEEEVVILEADERIGRKLLKTGSGRCNLAHEGIRPENYNHPRDVAAFMAREREDEVLATLASFGILTKTDGEGRIYPESESASALLNILVACLDGAHVKVMTGITVNDLREEGQKTIVAGIAAERVIIATGGKSQTKADGFALFRSLGLKVVPPSPALVGIRTAEDVHALAGIRRKAMLDAGSYQEKGEVQFKSDGLSGIVMMNYSRKSRDGDAFTLDLVPEKTEEEIEAFLSQDESETLARRLLSFFPLPLAQAFSRLPRERVAHAMKAMPFTRKGLYGFDEAQVTRGGLALSEVAPDFSLIRHPSLHAIGEALDVDGECGGYNLYFAWLSACLLARSL